MLPRDVSNASPHRNLATVNHTVMRPAVTMPLAILGAAGMVGICATAMWLLTWLPTWGSSSSIDDHRATFTALDSDGQREMLRKWERFKLLTESEREKLQKFHEQLCAHPEVDHLATLINQYYDWNLSLSDRERTDISVATSDQKLDRIRQYRLSQYERNLGRDEATLLSFEDLKVFKDWAFELAQRARENRRQRGRGNDENFRGFRGLEGLASADLDTLQSRFSSPAAAIMESAKSAGNEERDGRVILIWKWADAMFRPSQSTLKSVYDSLEDDERAAMLEMSDLTPESINLELKKHYFRRLGLPFAGPPPWNRPPGPGPRPPAGAGPPPPPGDAPPPEGRGLPQRGGRSGTDTSIKPPA